MTHPTSPTGRMSLCCSDTPRPVLSGPKNWGRGAGGGEGGSAGGNLPILPSISRDMAQTSKVEQVQAGTSRENERTSRGNLGKQDTIVSTDFSCPATVDLIYTMENGSVPLKNS